MAGWRPFSKLRLLLRSKSIIFEDPSDHFQSYDFMVGAVLFLDLEDTFRQRLLIFSLGLFLFFAITLKKDKDFFSITFFIKISRIFIFFRSPFQEKLKLKLKITVTLLLKIKKTPFTPTPFTLPTTHFNSLTPL